MTAVDLEHRIEAVPDADAPDYVRPERRIDTFHDYEQLLVAIRAGRADAAEVLMRKIMTDTRDEVLGYMAQSHTDTVDAFRQQVY